MDIAQIVACLRPSQSTHRAIETPHRVVPLCEHCLEYDDGHMDDDYVEAVLSLVERIPAGRVMAYGAIAAEVGAHLDRGGPRQVARVLATWGGGVPWWRVVTVDGRLPPGKEAEARRALAAEGCPMRGAGRESHVDMRNAAWAPPRSGG